MNELRQIDLNLLLPLHMLLVTGSVSEAARRLHTSQPTMSRQLAKLRRLTGDPLLVRSGERYMLTEKALHLKGRLEDLLPEIRRLLNSNLSEELAPMHFTLAAPDYTLKYVLCDIIAAQMEREPGIGFSVESWNAYTKTKLINGDLHFAISLDEAFPNDMVRRLIGKDSLLVVGRSEHPALSSGRPDLRTLLEYPFIDVLTGGGWQNPVEKELAQRKLARRVRVHLQSYEEAFLISARSDLLLMVPRHVAANSHEARGLAWREFPVPLPKLHYCLWWHKIHQDNGAHRWFREHIVPQILTHPALINLEMPKE